MYVKVLHITNKKKHNCIQITLIVNQCRNSLSKKLLPTIYSFLAEQPQILLVPHNIQTLP